MYQKSVEQNKCKNSAENLKHRVRKVLQLLKKGCLKFQLYSGQVSSLILCLSSGTFPAQ